MIHCRSLAQNRAFTYSSAETFQQSRAAFKDIRIGDIESAGVPRVADIIAASRIGEQLMHLAAGVAAEYTADIPHIPVVHRDKQVVFIVIGCIKLHGALAPAGDTVLMQLLACGRVYGVADLLGAGRSRGYVKLVRETRVSDEFFHYKFRHRRTAYVAVAYKHNLYHSLKPP